MQLISSIEQAVRNPNVIQFVVDLLKTSMFVLAALRTQVPQTKLWTGANAKQCEPNERTNEQL